MVEGWWMDGKDGNGAKTMSTLNKEAKQRLEERTFKGHLVLPAALSHFWAVLPFF